MIGVLGWLALAINVGGLIDAARRPSVQWHRAGRSKDFWTVALFFFGYLFLVPYLIAVRPRLQLAGLVAQPQVRPPATTASGHHEPPRAEKGGPVTTAVVVQNRSGTRSVPALGLKCDEREIPEALESGSEADYWLAGVGAFEGSASLLGGDDSLTPGYEVGVTGTAALAVVGGQLICIVSPTEATAPAIWLAVRLAELRVTTKGTTGVFKKRPAGIRVDCDGWGLVLGRVSTLDRSTSRIQSAQESSLLSALEGAAQP